MHAMVSFGPLVEVPCFFLLCFTVECLMKMTCSLCNVASSGKNKSNSVVKTSVLLMMSTGYLIYQRLHSQSRLQLYFSLLMLMSVK